MKGIIYIMTTAVSGLIKIGQTEISNYKERMRNLEANGYYNVSGLKNFDSIELEDYKEKENILKEIFSKHQIDDSELFALDCELVKQLLLSFEGKVIYPENINKEKEFDNVTKIRKQGELFNFIKGFENGDEIVFCDDKTIKAKVCGEREVEFEGQIWKLSPLAYEIYKRKNKLK